MSHYTHFTVEERELSMVLIAQGFSLRAAARKLNRSPSSLCRELKRNTCKNGVYSACIAEKRYIHRRKNCHKVAILEKNDFLKEFVTNALMLGWTPDEISGRIKEQQLPFYISYNTIYRAIDSGIIPKHYRRCLRFKHIKNRKRKTNDKRGKIPDITSINERPKEVDDRIELGHWEGDTVLGKRGTGCFGTLTERVSGLLLAFKLEQKKDYLFNAAAIKVLSTIPKELKKTLTVDKGSEFYSHVELSKQTGMKIYFCDPYSPWQRGTNENTNGLLRYYFPKKTSFSEITDEKLAYVVDLINNRPRKRLGYKTPLEFLSQVLHLD